MTDPDGELITTSDEFLAAVRVLARRGVRKCDLAKELGRSMPAVWAWGKPDKAPPRYCALHLKAQHGITKATLSAA